MGENGQVKHLKPQICSFKIVTSCGQNQFFVQKAICMQETSLLLPLLACSPLPQPTPTLCV